MLIKFLMEHRRRLSPLSVKTHPAGSVADVPDAEAIELCKTNIAETHYDKAAVIDAFATGMIAEQKAADAKVLDALGGRGDDVGIGTDAGDPVSYADLTIPELLAFAVSVGLDVTPLGKRPKKADLVAALEAHEQAVTGGEPA